MKLLLLAGEDSGLVYAERLKRLLPDAEVRGYADYGFATSDLAVMGILPVLAKLPYFVRVGRTMKRAIDEWRPDVVVTIDYPGMNLKLAAHAKARGIPAVHVVCPQVWAWHQGRIPKIAASVTRLMCFLPFEPPLFDGVDAKDFKAVFVGHPLLDIARAETTRKLENSKTRKLVALLPGSRMGEISRILPRLLRVAELLGPDVRFEIPAATPKALAQIESIVAKWQAASKTRKLEDSLTIRLGGARDVLRSATCAAVASGTATLEAALVGCPTALVYAVSPTFAFAVRHFVKGVRHAGLANVIADKCGGEPPMPEFLQENFVPETVAALLRKWLDDPAAHAEAKAALARTMEKLVSDGDALGLVAKEVLALSNSKTRKLENSKTS